MPIFTAAIAGVTPDPEVYGGLTAALAYIGAKFGPGATAWLQLTPSQQGQTLVESTRYLDEQPWNGAATELAGGLATTLQWPRSGIRLASGAELDATSVPPEVVQAAFELAVLIATKPAIVEASDTGNNVSSVAGGGGVSVSYFHPTSVRNGTATRLPTVIDRLIGKYLGGPSVGSDGAYGQGSGAVSQFGRCHSLTRTGPF